MTELLAAAVEAARLAGEVLRARFEQHRTIEFKGEGRVDLVTDADRASEEVLLWFLSRRFPEHGILAEESGAVASGAHTWLVDPLDGTTNYAHQVPHFAVTLAVEGPWEGEQRLLAGVVFDPLRDEVFAAAFGHGATLNGRPLAVSGPAGLGEALLATGFPYDLHQHPEAPLALFDALARQARGVRRLGSAALDLAYVACGRFDGFFELGLKPWDIAAGALLVQEAGGVASCVDGAALDLRRGDVLAGSPVLHQALAALTGPALTEVGWKPRRPAGGFRRDG